MKIKKWVRVVRYKNLIVNCLVITASQTAYLVSNHLGYHISGMYINSTDGHNLLSVTLRQLTDQHSNEVIQLLNLLLVVLFQCILITFLQSSECYIYFCGPPNLSTAQSNLKKEQLLNDLPLLQNVLVDSFKM